MQKVEDIGATYSTTLKDGVKAYLSYDPPIEEEGYESKGLIAFVVGEGPQRENYSIEVPTDSIDNSSEVFMNEAAQIQATKLIDLTQGYEALQRSVDSRAETAQLGEKRLGDLLEQIPDEAEWHQE